MALDEDLADRMRVVLAGTGAVREVRMFGGLCFMLNGYMVAGTSKRGRDGDVAAADGGLCLS